MIEETQALLKRAADLLEGEAEDTGQENDDGLVMSLGVLTVLHHHRLEEVNGILMGMVNGMADHEEDDNDLPF